MVGDLLLIKGSQQILIDVSVTRPTAPTYAIRNYNSNENARVLQQLKEIEKAKTIKYYIIE